jgi:uncharacterized membrane protein (DUF485 family)
MNEEILNKIQENPKFKELVEKRSSFSIKLSIAMLVVYFAFILTIAFNPSALGTPISDGSVTTIGIPVGIAVIIFAFILTGVYTQRANSEFDELSNSLKDSIKDEL